MIANSPYLYFLTSLLGNKFCKWSHLDFYFLLGSNWIHCIAASLSTSEVLTIISTWTRLWYVEAWKIYWKLYPFILINRIYVILKSIRNWFQFNKTIFSAVLLLKSFYVRSFCYYMFLQEIIILMLTILTLDVYQNNFDHFNFFPHKLNN